jgi:subtilisin family serine protease
VGLLCAAGLAASAAAFPNTASDASQQWYLAVDNAWSAWATEPQLAPVKVAVIDSGIDAGDPAFAGRIAAGRSFVPGSSWRTDENGHGTFVAGLIAASPPAGQGMAGIAFNTKLLIAKVVQGDGNVSAAAEARAILWAVAEGARVINLSLGALRDPQDPEFDGYSQVEHDAVEYAASRGIVVVAAVGNGTNAPKQPWDYADWPAALPHVLGVAAVNRDGSVPGFSNRDAAFADIAAPGVGIFSTIPRNLVVASDPGCNGEPFSNCGPAWLSNAEGTSFAAPQVAAAAALLLGVDPALTGDQVDWLLERSATDVNAATGCAQCPSGRDALTGWGLLDVKRAVDNLCAGAALPAPVTYEPNDSVGDASPLGPLPRTLTSSLDFWDDPTDFYSIVLPRGAQVVARLGAGDAAGLVLRLWAPGTPRAATSDPHSSQLVATSTLAGGEQVLRATTAEAGRYSLEILDGAPSRFPAAYALAVSLGATAAPPLPAPPAPPPAGASAGLSCP